MAILPERRRLIMSKRKGARVSGDSSVRRTTAIKKQIRELRPAPFLFLTIAGVINAFGVTIFLYPV